MAFSGPPYADWCARRCRNIGSYGRGAGYRFTAKRRQKLKNAGFTGIPAAANLGRNRRRMTFRARPAARHPPSPDAVAELEHGRELAEARIKDPIGI
jgi:hypothetical protein